MADTTGKKKTAFLFRLSNIILVQGLFVFAALGLILFYPLKADQANLGYILFVLFLFSTLISLLTVYFIHKRFKSPLHRLMRAIEKTSEGRVYHLVESDGDEEINKLTHSFNQMTRSLWDKQIKIKDANNNLKKSNISLIESQMFLAALVDNSPLCIMVTSSDHKIMLFNRKATEVFGYEGSEVLGENIRRLFNRPVEEPKIEVTQKQATEAGFEVICRRKDGESFAAFFIMAPIVTVPGSNMRVNLYIIRDISESKNFQEMMVRLDRYYTRGQMAGDIAHEINNYLAILSGNIELMPLFLKKGDTEKINKKLELMKETVDRISRFADGLMDVPQDKPIFEPADINQLIENVLAFLKPQNRFDYIEFELSLSNEIPMVEIDPGQIQQLLVNFIFNAADALSKVETEKRIRLKTDQVGDGQSRIVRLEVADSGPGVPEEKREILFQKRFTTKRKGHGIGLITCRRIAEIHQGKVGYEMKEDSVFYLEIPVIKRQVESVEKDSGTIEESQPIKVG